MAGDKTEKATPKKRRDERKKGNVMMSKDVVAVATLLGSLAMLRIMGDTVVEQAKNLFASSFSLIAESGAAAAGQSLRELFTRCILVFVTVAGPFLAVTALLAVAATFAQTRMLVTGESLKPKFNRISPLQGFKRLFSMRSVVETLKSLLKIVVLLYLIFSYFGDTAVGFSRFFDMELGQACSILFNDILALVLRVAVAFVVLAGADFFYQWWDYERQMRMSKQEIKEE